MAIAYKNVTTLVASTGDVTVYTCPSVTQSIIKNITLAQTSLAGPFVLEASDVLILNCDTASKIFAVASILEVS